MTAWDDLKKKGNSDEKLSPIELAIFNLWHETQGFEPQAESAAASLATLQADLTYYKQLYNEVAAKLNTANHKLSQIKDFLRDNHVKN